MIAESARLAKRKEVGHDSGLAQSSFGEDCMSPESLMDPNYVSILRAFLAAKFVEERGPESCE